MSGLNNEDGISNNGSRSNINDNIPDGYITTNSGKSECYIASPLNSLSKSNVPVGVIGEEHRSIVDLEKDNISDEEITNNTHEDEEICTDVVVTSNVCSEINSSTDTVENHPGANLKNNSLSDNDNTKNIKGNKEMCTYEVEFPNYCPEIYSGLSKVANLVHSTIIVSEIDKNTTDYNITEDDNTNNIEENKDMFNDETEIHNSVSKESSEVKKDQLNVQHVVSLNSVNSLIVENNKSEIQNYDSAVITKSTGAEKNSMVIQNNVLENDDKSFNLGNNYMEKEDAAFVESSDYLRKLSQENKYKEVNISKNDKINEIVCMELTNDLNTSLIADIQVQLTKMHDNTDKSTDDENTVFGGSTANTNVEESSPLDTGSKKNKVSNLETNDDDLSINISSVMESNKDIVENAVDKNDSINCYKPNSDLFTETQRNAAEVLKNSNTTNSSSTSIITIDESIHHVTSDVLEKNMFLNTCTDSVCNKPKYSESSEVSEISLNSTGSILNFTPFPPRNVWLQIMKDFNEFMRKASGFPIITNNQGQKSKCSTKIIQNNSNKKSTKNCYKSIIQSSSTRKSPRAINVQSTYAQKNPDHDISDCSTDFYTNSKKKRKITKTIQTMHSPKKSTSTCLSSKLLKTSYSSKYELISENKNSAGDDLKVKKKSTMKKDVQIVHKSSFSTTKRNQKNKNNVPSSNVLLRVSRRLCNKNISQPTSENSQKNTQSKAISTNISHISKLPSKHSPSGKKCSQTSSKLTPVRKKTLIKGKTEIKKSKLMYKNSKNSSEYFSDNSSPPARKETTKLTTYENDEAEIKESNSCVKSKTKIGTSSIHDDNELNNSTEVTYDK